MSRHRKQKRWTSEKKFDREHRRRVQHDTVYREQLSQQFIPQTVQLPLTLTRRT